MQKHFFIIYNCNLEKQVLYLWANSLMKKQ